MLWNWKPILLFEEWGTLQCPLFKCTEYQRQIRRPTIPTRNRKSTKYFLSCYLSSGNLAERRCKSFTLSDFRSSMYIKRKDMFQTWRLNNLFTWKIRFHWMEIKTVIPQFGKAISSLLLILRSIKKLYLETYTDHHLTIMMEKMLHIS